MIFSNSSGKRENTRIADFLGNIFRKQVLSSTISWLLCQKKMPNVHLFKKIGMYINVNKHCTCAFFCSTERSVR